VLAADGTAWQTEAPRAVTFWDTEDFALSARDFVLRRRLAEGDTR
jgi:hypothetical protein